MVLEVEIEIENEELGESEQEVPQEEAYAATASKLRKADVRVSHLSAEERRQFTSAKDKEIATWIKHS
eukprot:4844501-Prorocentrum_lima.AAC.1